MTLAVSSTGAISWPLRNVTGGDAVKARIRTVLGTIQGERPENVGVGLPLAWIEGVPAAPGQVEAVVRAQLRPIFGVETVTGVAVTDDEGARTISATVTASTIDGLVDLTIGEPLPYDTRGAPAWYLTSGDLLYGRGPSWTGS